MDLEIAMLEVVGIIASATGDTDLEYAQELSKRILQQRGAEKQDRSHLKMSDDDHMYNLEILVWRLIRHISHVTDKAPSPITEQAVVYMTTEGRSKFSILRRKEEMAARNEFDKRLDEVLHSLHGPRDKFRTLLTDTHSILARICSKAEELAERQGREPSSVIADWTGIGTIAAAAIYRVYKREQPAEI